MIDTRSRGCPKCARNLDAERMIDKVVFGGLTFVMAAAVAIVLLLYVRH